MTASALLESVRVSRVMNAVAAGQTEQTSSTVDMQADNGYLGVMFIALLGTLTASQVTSMKAQQSADDITYADLLASDSGNLADDDDDQCIIIDIFKPSDRYQQVDILRATANAVIDGVVAIQYGPRTKPTTQDATTIALSALHVTPIEGTA